MNSIPSRVGKYVVSGVVGRGGMGAVYRGTDPVLQRQVAIKVLHDLALAEGESQQRFLQEARAAASLRHENIVTIYEVGQYDGFTYVAMEYVGGETLSQIVRGGRSFALGDVLSWIDQLCSGLSLAHARGVVHRDIKPANLMVDEHGVLRILDFGIARVEGSTMTAEGALIGTLNYMSPEQVLGQRTDLRSDIFAVGATAYELLSGQQAFPGGAGLAVQRILNADPPALSSIRRDLPAELDDIVGRALAKDPARRFGDLREMQGEIRAVRARLDETNTTESKLVPTPVVVDPTLVPAVDPTLVPAPTIVDPTLVAAPVAVEPLLTAAPALVEPTRVLERSPEPTPANESDDKTTAPQRWKPSLLSPRTARLIVIAGIASLIVAAAIGLLPLVFEWAFLPSAHELLEQRSIAPHFVDEVLQAVEERRGPNALDRGLRVTTTLDPKLQQLANAAVDHGVHRIDGIQAALVAIHNATGQIRVLVGGSAQDTINRARRERPLGSLFMPVIYTAAIDRGFTSASIMPDEPVTFSTLGETDYSPTNDDGLYRGPITLRRAFEESSNVVAARLADQLGEGSVREYANGLGLHVASSGPSWAVAIRPDATLVDVTSAYAAIANQGIRTEPHTIVSVADHAGVILDKTRVQPKPAIRADTAFVITHLLTSVIKRGTGADARVLAWTLAGKTGTVDNNTDFWFIGFDPDITVGVWIGYDDKRPIRSKQAGTTTALSIWIEFMRGYISSRADRSNPPGFNAPDNIVFATGESGVLEPFIKGTEPSRPKGR